MPLRNNLFGVFKTGGVLQDSGRYKPVLIESASQNKEMEVNAKTYVQGTAENRILDIGNLSETIQLKSPILVGGGENIDGRSLLGDMIARAADSTSQTLPILKSAVVNVSSDSGGTVDFTLQSDGSTVTPPFKIFNTPTDSELELVSEKTMLQWLDPLSVTPSRVARNYDFTVQFGTYAGYVQSAQITVTVDTQPTQFFFPYDPAVALAEPLMGSQYPFLGVAGISVKGTGRAAVDVGVTNDPQIAGQGVTVQSYDGVVLSGDQDFVINIGSTNLLPAVDISKAVINSTKFDVTTKLLSVDFGFTAWVKIGA